MTEQVLSPGGSLRLLAASLPGLGRLLVDKEDLQLVRIRMMIMMVMMIELLCCPSSVFGQGEYLELVTSDDYQDYCDDIVSEEISKSSSQ